MSAMSQEWNPQRPANNANPIHPATNSAWSAQAGWQPVGAAPGWGTYPPSPAPTTDDDNPFEALLDFGFRRYATPGLVKILYVVLLAAITVSLLFALVAGLAMLGDDFTVGIGLITIVGSLFGAFTAVLLVRVCLEYSIAVVRMASDVARLRERSAASGGAGAQPPLHL